MLFEEEKEESDGDDLSDDTERKSCFMVKLIFQFINPKGEFFKKARVFGGFFFVVVGKKYVPRCLHPVRDHGYGNAGKEERERDNGSKKKISQSESDENITNGYDSRIEFSAFPPVCAEIPVRNGIQQKVREKGKGEGCCRIFGVNCYRAGNQCVGSF